MSLGNKRQSYQDEMKKRLKPFCLCQKACRYTHGMAFLVFCSLQAVCIIMIVEYYDPMLSAGIKPNI